MKNILRSISSVIKLTYDVSQYSYDYSMNEKKIQEIKNFLNNL